MVARGERDREAQTHACTKIKAPFSRSQNSSEQKSGREKRVGSMAEALRYQEDEEEARGGDGERFEVDLVFLLFSFLLTTALADPFLVIFMASFIVFPGSGGLILESECCEI